MGGLCIARAQELYDELKKFVKKCAASRNNSARLPRSWKTLRAFAYQGGSRKAPLARTALGKVKIAEDWAISLPVPKSVMVAHGTASQTERESLDDDGLASQNRVKVQSGPFGNVGDKPCIQQLDPRITHRTRLYVNIRCVPHTWYRSTTERGMHNSLKYRHSFLPVLFLESLECAKLVCELDRRHRHVGARHWDCPPRCAFLGAWGKLLCALCAHA